MISFPYGAFSTEPRVLHVRCAYTRCHSSQHRLPMKIHGGETDCGMNSEVKKGVELLHISLRSLWKKFEVLEGTVFDKMGFIFRIHGFLYFICELLSPALRSDPPEGIEASPLDKMSLHWQASIRGPAGSPYEGGTFYLYIQIPPR